MYLDTGIKRLELCKLVRAKTRLNSARAIRVILAISSLLISFKENQERFFNSPSPPKLPRASEALTEKKD